ncbi:MAG: hypothetical protein M9924_14880 [Rhizobiaceae bacterium]|nr:hypothetical protein [Rhizobiaceae bacterium]
MNYKTDTAAIADARKRSTTAVAGCCACVYLKDGTHGPSYKLRQFNIGGTKYTYDHDFDAEIIIDGEITPPMIYVNTRLKGNNYTEKSDISPGTIKVSDETFKKYLKSAETKINNAWNKGPYKLKITDKKCGEREFEVRFNVGFTDESPHYEVYVVNSPKNEGLFDPFGHHTHVSWVDQEDHIVKLNIGGYWEDEYASTADPLTAPHEYGHMIGLLDEYQSFRWDFNGCKYKYNSENFGELFRNGLMSCDDMFAKPCRYLVTIADAVAKIFAENGVRVTNLEIKNHLEDEIKEQLVQIKRGPVLEEGTITAPLAQKEAFVQKRLDLVEKERREKQRLLDEEAEFVDKLLKSGNKKAYKKYMAEKLKKAEEESIDRQRTVTS